MVKCRGGKKKKGGKKPNYSTWERQIKNILKTTLW